MTKIEIKTNDVGQKIFTFIKKMFRDTSLSIIYKWFRLGKIKVNNKKIKTRDYILQEGDVVLVFDSTSTVLKREWQKVNFDSLDIVYEDENILIVDKDSNVEIHSEFNVCLDNMVRSYLSSKGEMSDENSFIVSHVHRLDKLTSGLVIYAKNKQSLDYFLSVITSKNKVRKTYVAKIEGTLKRNGIVSGFIDYNPVTQKANFKFQEFRGAKQAILDIVNIENNIATIDLVTGKKHQIRATLEYLNAPIVNDFRYGAKRRGDLKAILLNAHMLTFNELSEPFSYLNGQVFESKKGDF